MTDAIYVQLYLDHHSVGCGFRQFIILKRGPVWATLLYLPTVSRLKVPVGVLEKATPVPVSAAVARRRLREAVAMRARLGLSMSAGAAKEARRLLG